MSFGFYDNQAQNISKLYGRLTGYEGAVDKARVHGAKPTFGSLVSFAGAGAMTGGLITFISCKMQFAQTTRLFADPTGPFELTKLYSQIYVIIQEEERKRKLKEALAKGLVVPEAPPGPKKFIRGEGTFKVGRRIVRDRGVFGLFTGFKLHFSMLPCSYHEIIWQ